MTEVSLLDSPVAARAASTSDKVNPPKVSAPTCNSSRLVTTPGQGDDVTAGSLRLCVHAVGPIIILRQTLDLSRRSHLQ